MKILERNWGEYKGMETEIILLVSDSTMRNYNVAVSKAKPIINLTNVTYLFPNMVSEERAAKKYKEMGFKG